MNESSRKETAVVPARRLLVLLIEKSILKNCEGVTSESLSQYQYAAGRR